jgi:undecaprenyl-diphosphatase
LNLIHRFNDTTSGFFVPWSEFLGIATDNGLVFLAVGVGLFALGHRRRAVTLVGAVGLAGALALAAKSLVARPRPFADPAYHWWWANLGIPVESGWAFPSGHTTTAAAAALVLFLWFDKRWSWVGFLAVALVGLSRCLLLAHYPSDVVAAVVLGTASAGLWVVVSRAAFARVSLLGGRR